MNLYKIKDWQLHFETNETRKLKTLNWWPNPNKHDGLGFCRIVTQDSRIELFAAWKLLCDIASKTTPQTRRGYLERDNLPLSPGDMATVTGFPADMFERALVFFSTPPMTWLCVESAGAPGESAGESGNYPAVGNGREWKVENGKKGSEIVPLINGSGSVELSPTRIILHERELRASQVRTDKLKARYANGEVWHPKDKTEFDMLKARQIELKDILGVKS